ATPAAPDYAKDAKVATREAYGFALKRLGAANPNVVAISVDVKNSTFSQVFGDAYPDHFWQGYIAEQNMVSVAVGLQARGKTPFADTFACFLSRAYDNVSWRPSAARTSTCAGRTVASRSVRTVHRRWRSRISPCSARC